jgi:hypothetical protein
MPAKTQCRRCEKVGFVRFEHVIRGGRAERHYYCGACNHSWTVTDDGTKRQRGSLRRIDRARPGAERATRAGLRAD